MRIMAPPQRSKFNTSKCMIMGIMLNKGELQSDFAVTLTCAHLP